MYKTTNLTFHEIREQTTQTTHSKRGVSKNSYFIKKGQKKFYWPQMKHEKYKTMSQNPLLTLHILLKPNKE